MLSSLIELIHDHEKAESVNEWYRLLSEVRADYLHDSTIETRTALKTASESNPRAEKEWWALRDLKERLFDAITYMGPSGGRHDK